MYAKFAKFAKFAAFCFWNSFVADRQINGLTKSFIAARKILQLSFKTSNIDGAFKIEENAQYWYVQYKYAFFLKEIDEPTNRIYYMVLVFLSTNWIFAKLSQNSSFRCAKLVLISTPACSLACTLSDMRKCASWQAGLVEDFWLCGRFLTYFHCLFW